MKPNYSAEWY